MRSILAFSSILLVLAAIVWAVALAGPSGKPLSALIVVYDFDPSTGGHGKRCYRLNDHQQLAELESFFPDYRKLPSSMRAGSWVKGYDIYFDFPDGHSIRLVASPPPMEPAFWSVTRGDLMVEGDFHKFVADLAAAEKAEIKKTPKKK